MNGPVMVNLCLRQVLRLVARLLERLERLVRRLQHGLYYCLQEYEVTTLSAREATITAVGAVWLES